MLTIFSFRSIENKHDVYRGKDSMKKFCESLRENAMKINNFIKKKLKLLTKDPKICYFYKEKLENKCLKDKNIVKLGIIVTIHGNIEVLRIAYVS